mmetsp:Transcript_16595/g.19969  ORF Transcript_16595/g.19969 Transcript_16595/m.19969 type:complete len:105 (-) Transcript_16595:225-539(-)
MLNSNININIYSSITIFNINSNITYLNSSIITTFNIDSLTTFINSNTTFINSGINSKRLFDSMIVFYMNITHDLDVLGEQSSTPILSNRILHRNSRKQYAFDNI